jgi:hypothetical protein
MRADRQRKQRAARWKRKRIPGYTPEDETAAELNISVRTLRKWRQLKIGPPWVEIGRQIHYPDESRSAWIRAASFSPSGRPHDGSTSRYGSVPSIYRSVPTISSTTQPGYPVWLAE